MKEKTNIQKIKDLLDRVEKEEIQSPRLTPHGELQLQLRINKIQDDTRTKK